MEVSSHLVGFEIWNDGAGLGFYFLFCRLVMFSSAGVGRNVIPKVIRTKTAFCPKSLNPKP